MEIEQHTIRYSVGSGEFEDSPAECLGCFGVIPTHIPASEWYSVIHLNTGIACGSFHGFVTALCFVRDVSTVADFNTSDIEIFFNKQIAERVKAIAKIYGAINSGAEVSPSWRPPEGINADAVRPCYEER